MNLASLMISKLWLSDHFKISSATGILVMKYLSILDFQADPPVLPPSNLYYGWVIILSS